MFEVFGLFFFGFRLSCPVFRLFFLVFGLFFSVLGLFSLVFGLFSFGLELSVEILDFFGKVFRFSFTDSLANV
jgi:hypothetical protein